MNMNVIRKRGKVICFVDYEAEQEAVKQSVEQLHNVFVLDRSGSMSWDIDTAIDNTKAALKVIPETDLVSVIWFSGAGQCKTLIKGAKNDATLLGLLDTLKSTVGCTCFSEPLMEVADVIKDLKVICPNFAINLFTDGCPVVPWSEKEEVNRIHAAIDGWKEDVLALNTIGYGNYYNAELLKEMSAKTMFGQFVHNSKIHELADIFTHNYSKLKGMKLETVEVLSEQAEITYLTPKTVQYFGKELRLHTIDKDLNIFILCGEGEFTFSLNGTDYSTVDLDESASSLNEETTLYALAYDLYYRGKKQESLDILAGFIGDKVLVDGQMNAFTPDERAVYQKAIEDAVFNKASRNVGTCDASYLPKEDAFCVMDLLKLLAGAEGTKYIYSQNYNKIGLATKEAVTYFKKDEGIVATDFKDLVLNKEKVNVSIRSKIQGKVSLNPTQAERVGLNPVIDSYIYRTQTIIKDGYLNMPTLQFAVTAPTMQLLQKVAEENENFQMKLEGVLPSTDIVKREIVTIDLTKLPVINRMYVNKSANLSSIFANTLESLKLEAEQKMANYVLKQSKAALGEETGEFAKLTDEQVVLLKDFGVDENLAYVGVDVIKADKGEDYYEARNISYSIKGSASLPSGADVIKKMDAGKAQNYAGELMENWYQELLDYTSKFETDDIYALLREKVRYCTAKLDEIKKQLLEKRFATCILNMAVVLTNYWFEDADVDAKGNVTYTDGDKTLVIKATKEKVYY